jgi:GNAT superfamily N-acetyltransferase
MSAPGVQVRAGRPEDAEKLAGFNLALALETENLQLDPATVREGVSRVLSDASLGRYFVAEVEGQVAGCLMITTEWSDWRNGPMWWIQSVYVAKEFRRRGVFRSLHAAARDEAVGSGARALRLYVERHNTAAQQTYLSLGLHLTEYLVMEEPLNQPPQRPPP